MNQTLALALASMDELLAELRAGRPVIMVDDENRENEGDIIIPAEKVSAELIAFTIRYTGGVICLAMPNELADHLELPPMVEHNGAPRQTAYTVSIEAREGVGSGIIGQGSRDHDPDHGQTGRVARKTWSGPATCFRCARAKAACSGARGHTEAAVDLCRLAGFKPVGAISELMHDDGTMMRLPAILEFARAHELKVGAIAHLIAYRLERDMFVKPIAHAKLPTRTAEFTSPRLSRRPEGQRARRALARRHRRRRARCSFACTRSA